MYYRPKIFFPKKTYSMIGEDLFVDWFFKKKKIGFYVDVGCYHPLQLSNTYLLYKRGWSGINIDLDKNSTFNEYRFMSCALTNTLFAGHSGEIKYHPQAEKLVGLSIFKNDLEMTQGLKNLLFDSSHLLNAFTAQYEFAEEHKKKFDIFIRQHFSK